MSERPIFLVGGGTGGHVFPLVAVAEELESKKIPFIFVGSPNSLEERVVTKRKWQFLTIESGKWRRYLDSKSIFSNIIDIFRLIKGFFQAMKILRKHRARLVFSKGGFVALPLLYAARVIGCPIIVHESDSVMGVANRVGSKYAKKILTAFDPKVFPNVDSRFMQVGIPIRRSLQQASKLKSPRKVRPVILVLPGSQGATAINKLIKQSLLSIIEKYDLIHLTGESDFKDFEKLRSTMTKVQQERYRPYHFIDRELPYYFQLADLIIARSSATTTAEAALFKKALFAIPLPGSANNHQQINAQILNDIGAAYIREQYQLSGEQFLSSIDELLGNQSTLQTMGENLAKYFGSNEATTKTVKVLIDEG